MINTENNESVLDVVQKKEFIKNIRDKFNEGDVVKAQVVEVNKDTQKIKLSIKKIEIEEEKREEREQIEKYSTSSSEE